MGKALYRKYRSKSLDEIIGQPHITSTLQNALKSGKTSHAYLFTGPRGVGKTSIARILAHELNQIPYDETATHLDIIEIDAASNRRIDEIRELRERVHTAPTTAQYKVYIIDEVHMLTKEAFNALLKTLEEPPAHAVFILATTEAHKLPETIVSRTQRFTFKPVEQSAVIAHLRHIAEQEQLDIDDAGLALIAEHGEGSFRDSISMLDQVRGHADKVTLENVQSMLGIAPDQLIADILTALQQGSSSQIVSLLGQCKDQGYSASQIAKQLAGALRTSLLRGESPIPSSLLAGLLEKLLLVPAAHDPNASLELCLIEITLNTTPVAQVPAPVITTQVKPIKSPVATKKTPAQITPVVSEEPSDAPTPPATPEPTTEPILEEKSVPVSGNFDISVWELALESIKQSHNTLYSVARMAAPSIQGDELTLTFKFAFHQKRLNETKNKQVITDIVQKTTARPVVITCVVGAVEAPASKAAVVTQPVAATTSTTTLSTISNIFGGAEVLES